MLLLLPLLLSLLLLLPLLLLLLLLLPLLPLLLLLLLLLAAVWIRDTRKGRSVKGLDNSRRSRDKNNP